eukprot:SAG31_NODE_8393_length_1460_cov_1.161646_2_plen_182_part_00
MFGGSSASLEHASIVANDLHECDPQDPHRLSQSPRSWSTCPYHYLLPLQPQPMQKLAAVDQLVGSTPKARCAELECQEHDQMASPAAGPVGAAAGPVGAAAGPVGAAASPVGAAAGPVGAVEAPKARCADSEGQGQGQDQDQDQDQLVSLVGASLVGSSSPSSSSTSAVATLPCHCGCLCF